MTTAAAEEDGEGGASREERLVSYLRAISHIQEAQRRKRLAPRCPLSPWTLIWTSAFPRGCLVFLFSDFLIPLLVLIVSFFGSEAKHAPPNFQSVVA